MRQDNIHTLSSMNQSFYKPLIITLTGVVITWLLREVTPADAANWFLSPWISPLQVLTLCLTAIVAIYFYRKNKKTPSPLAIINAIGVEGIEVPPFQGVKFYFTVLPEAESHLHSITEKDYKIDKIECSYCQSYSIDSCNNRNCNNWQHGLLTIPPGCALEEHSKANFLIELKHKINEII